MNKIAETEQRLRDAMDILLSGKPIRSDGKFTQENIALEAGVSRATFNRYNCVVNEYRLVKLKGSSHEPMAPFTIEDKNRELQESNTVLRKTLSSERQESAIGIAAARQEIFILTMAMQAKDKTIAEKEREIANLRRQLALARENRVPHIEIVKVGPQ